MVNIQFRDGKDYHLKTKGDNLHYVDTGDRHGNNNFRLNATYLSAYEVIKIIAPEMADDIVAVKMNGKTVPLHTSVSKDMQLDTVSCMDAEGRIIAARTVALLVMEILLSTVPQVQMESLTVQENEIMLCVTEDVGEAQTELISGWNVLLEENRVLRHQDIWQKSILMEEMTWLQAQPVFQKMLEPYDDFEIVPTVEHNGYLFPADYEAVYAMFPDTLKSRVAGFSVEGQIIRVMLQI